MSSLSFVRGGAYLRTLTGTGTQTITDAATPAAEAVMHNGQVICGNILSANGRTFAKPTDGPGFMIHPALARVWRITAAGLQTAPAQGGTWTTHVTTATFNSAITNYGLRAIKAWKLGSTYHFFVAAKASSSGTDISCYTLHVSTTDFTTWSSVGVGIYGGSFEVIGELRDQVFLVGSRFVMVTRFQNLYSTNGVSWTESVVSSPTYNRGVMTQSGRLYIFALNGASFSHLYTDDGDTWGFFQPAVLATNLRPLGYAHGRIYLNTATVGVLESDNPASTEWESSIISMSGSFEGAVYETPYGAGLVWQNTSTHQLTHQFFV